MASNTSAQPSLSADALQALLAAYDINTTHRLVTPFGSGLINSTWKIGFPQQPDAYIFQRVNDKIFKRPEFIAENIAGIGQYLLQNAPDYLFIQPIPTRHGQGMLHHPDWGWFRLFPFVPNSHTADTVADSRLAFEAARQFGRFSRQLHHFPARQLHTTLPDFHNLSLRYRQFEAALEAADPKTRQQCAPEITQMLQHKALVQQYEDLITHPDIQLRVIHHDTKISNCLFDKAGNGLCVIDLDTVMPGYFISDVGDMCRTYLCPTGEESTSLDDVTIRMDYYHAMATGYLQEMKPVLSTAEMDYFVYAGKFMIYMQALRFLSDFLNGNTYYPVKYALHNLNRTRHQIALLQAYCHSEPAMQQVVTALIN